MKKLIAQKLFIFICLIFLVIFLFSCGDPGNTRVKLQGTENQLPEDLKGLKVYEVKLNSGYCKVGVLNGNVNSVTYNQGKVQESIIIVNKTNQNVVTVKEIVFENDSLILCRK